MGFIASVWLRRRGVYLRGQFQQAACALLHFEHRSSLGFCLAQVCQLRELVEVLESLQLLELALSYFIVLLRLCAGHSISEKLAPALFTQPQFYRLRSADFGIRGSLELSSPCDDFISVRQGWLCVAPLAVSQDKVFLDCFCLWILHSPCLVSVKLLVDLRLRKVRNRLLAGCAWMSGFLLLVI